MTLSRSLFGGATLPVAAFAPCIPLGFLTSVALQREWASPTYAVLIVGWRQGRYAPRVRASPLEVTRLAGPRPYRKVWREPGHPPTAIWGGSPVGTGW